MVLFWLVRGVLKVVGKVFWSSRGRGRGKVYRCIICVVMEFLFCIVFLFLLTEFEATRE